MGAIYKMRVKEIEPNNNQFMHFLTGNSKNFEAYLPFGRSFTRGPIWFSRNVNTISASKWRRLQKIS